MIKQRQIAIKITSATLIVSEMGDIVINSSSATAMALPAPSPGLWYRFSNANSGIVTISYNSTTITTLKQTEQCLCLSNGTSAWFFSKGGGGMTKAEIEAVLTGTISSHNHVFSGSSAPTTSTEAGFVGQFYLETTTPALYQCTAISGSTYTWTGIGGSSYTLPQATESVLGGIKASAKTTETNEVKIDALTGKLYCNAPNEAVNGIPAGGTIGQVLAKTDGADYNTEWVTPSGGGGGGTTYENPIDEPPATPHAKNDEFNSTSLDSKWGWINQGSSTISLNGKQAIIDIGTMNDNLSSLSQSIPTGDFTAIAKVKVLSKGNNYYGSFLGFYNSANGRYSAIGKADRNIGAGYIHCTQPWHADILLTSGWGIGYVYSKAVKTENNYQLWFSTDGAIWIKALDEAIGNYLGAITHICISGYRNDTDGNTKAYAVCEWFRVTEP